MLPLIYSIALGRPEALPLDDRQRGEILLTAAQSLFAVVLLMNLRLSLIGAGILFSLFIIQMVLPETRTAVTITYFVLTVVVVLRARRQMFRAFRWLRLAKTSFTH